MNFDERNKNTFRSWSNWISKLRDGDYGKRFPWYFCRQNIKIITKTVNKSKPNSSRQWHLIFHPDLYKVKRRCKRPSLHHPKLISCILNANFLLGSFPLINAHVHVNVTASTLRAIYETLPSLWAHCSRLKSGIHPRNFSLAPLPSDALESLFYLPEPPTHFVYFREKKYSFLNIILLLPLNLSIPFNNEAFLLRL